MSKLYGNSNNKGLFQLKKLKNVTRAMSVCGTIVLTLGMTASYGAVKQPVPVTPIAVWYGIGAAGWRNWGYQFVDGSIENQVSTSNSFAYNAPPYTWAGSWAYATPGSLLFNRFEVAGVTDYDSGAYINQVGGLINLGLRGTFSYDTTWETASYYYDLLYKVLASGDMNSQANDDDKWEVHYVNQTREPITLYLAKDRLQAWSGSTGPDEIIVDPCSQAKQDYVRNIPQDLSGSAWTVTQNAMGSLVYNVVGPYTGAVVLLADWYAPTAPSGVQFSSGQNASGSTDWVGMDSGLPMCSPGQAYNCVQAMFISPKNVAGSIYTGGHGMSLRRYSSAFSDTNEATYIFKPVSASATCGPTQEAFDAFISQQIPKIMVVHPERFILSDGKTLKDDFPNIDPSLISGGMFAANWGVKNAAGVVEHGLPSFDINSNSVQVTSGKQTDPGTITWLDSSVNKLKNTSDISQTLSSAAYAHSVTISSSATTSHSWANQEGGKLSVTIGGKVNVFGDGTTVSATIEANYAHTDTQGDTQTCTTTDSDTYTAPAQPIFIPPHHEADVYWRFGLGKVTIPYTFQAELPNDPAITAKIGGRLVSIPNEWRYPDRYQAFNSDMVVIKPTRFTTNLYTLLDPSYGNALPAGITWDEKNKVFNLNGSGTANIEGASVLQVSVTMYQLKPNGDIDPNSGKTSYTNIPFKKKILLGDDPTVTCK